MTALLSHPDVSREPSYRQFLFCPSPYFLPLVLPPIPALPGRGCEVLWGEKGWRRSLEAGLAEKRPAAAEDELAVRLPTAAAETIVGRPAARAMGLKPGMDTARTPGRLNV